MSYGNLNPNYIDYISRDDVRKVVPEELGKLEKFMETNNISLSEISENGMGLQGGADVDEEELNRIITSLYDAFKEKTGIGLSIEDSLGDYLDGDLPDEAAYFVLEEIMDYTPKAKELMKICPSVDRLYYVAGGD